MEDTIDYKNELRIEMPKWMDQIIQQLIMVIEIMLAQKDKYYSFTI